MSEMKTKAASNVEADPAKVKLLTLLRSTPRGEFEETGGLTAAILDCGDYFRVGFAICADLDEFDTKDGASIAIQRLLAENKKKKIKKKKKNGKKGKKKEIERPIKFQFKIPKKNLASGEPSEIVRKIISREISVVGGQLKGLFERRDWFAKFAREIIGD